MPWHRLMLGHRQKTKTTKPFKIKSFIVSISISTIRWHDKLTLNILHDFTWVMTNKDGTSQEGINSLAPGKFELNFRYIIFKRISLTDGWGISCEMALIWMSLDLTDDQSTLVQVMAWCHQATSHYLSQCWPRSLSPYNVSRPQWVKSHGIYCLPAFKASNRLTLVLNFISKHKNIFAFSTISQYWYGTGSWNSSWWTTRTLHGQYYCWRWPGDTSSQDNSSHSFHLALPEYFGFSTRGGGY